MSSSVASSRDDLHPLVLSESLPSVNPVKLLVFFGLFVVLNDKLRGMYAMLAPSSVVDNIPGAGSKMEHVAEFDALVAMMIFSTALAFNLNAAAWSSHASKCKLNLQVAFISAVAAWTHREMWLGKDWYVVYHSASLTNGAGTVSFSGLRQLEWIFTTPVLLLVVQNLHAYAFAALPRKETRKEKTEKDDKDQPESSSSKKEILTKKSEKLGYQPANRNLLIAVDELMILCGLVMPLTSGMERLAFLLVACACFCYVVGHSVAALLDVLRFAKMTFLDKGRLMVIALLKCVAWSGYPTIYFLTEYGFLTCKQQHDLYLYNDVLTKFSYSLVISAGSLRFIEALDDRRASFAVHMSNVQRAFFFNITHELRTPLNSIIGFNTLAMESGELTDFTNSFIKASLTSAEALLGLINQILDFAKFEGAKDGSSGSSDSIELSEDVWTVRQLIEQVTDISQKASSRGVELVMLINQPEHFNTRFVSDFFRLRQCCINLVDNAIKYSSNVEGRTALVEFTVDVRSIEGKPHSSLLSFEVKDNGVGIPVEKQHALFVPFCQPADHASAKVKGTGLGLVITKAIIECMGGSIDYESVKDAYTRFFFHFAANHAQVTPRASTDGNTGEDGGGISGSDGNISSDQYETDDFVEDEFDVENDRLPPTARAVFHPSVSDNTRKHVGCIFKCFGARPGVHYVTVQREADLPAKIKQASQLGSPIILAGVDGVSHALEFVRKQSPDRPVGLLVLGLPYQIMELHRTIPDEPNVQFVLKPVKPSDLLKAVTKLANKMHTNERVTASDAEWLHESLGGDPREIAERLETAGLNAAHNTIESMKRSEIDAIVESEQRKIEKRRDSSVSRTSSEKSSDTPGGVTGGGGGGVTGNTTTAATVNVTANPSTGELSGMSVLLVEDNLMNQQMAKYSIVKAGADLEVANHGKEAVDMVTERLESGKPKYDCILMDMMMPIMDGAEATIAIREFEKGFLGKAENKSQTSHVIVGLSANVGPEYTAKVKEAGMNGSMSKPFYPATLRNTLAQVLNKTYQGFSRVSGEISGHESVMKKPGN